MVVIVQKINKLILLVCSTIRFVLYFNRGLNRRSGMPISIYFRESVKLVRYFWNQRGDVKIAALIKEFFLSDLSLCSDNLLLDESPTSPVVVVAVKDEIERMKLFYDHYRALGVHQFIVIDNDSSDGTREFVSSQRDTMVYLIKNIYQTQKRQAWIEKVLALTGYNRWYVVVDSDELLDYVGSENHTLAQLIDYHSNHGDDYLQGYLVDMYSEGPIFSVSCSYKEIPHICNLFDRNSYFIDGDKHVLGGSRHRLFGINNLLSKQTIFLFKPGVINCHSHYLYAGNKKIPDEFCYVLRHYKFLKKDRLSYEKRVEERSFHNNSIEYKNIMDQLKPSCDVSFEYAGSAKYDNSESLRVLPFLTWTAWDSQKKTVV